MGHPMDSPPENSPILVKLGGSLITDKGQRNTPRLGVLRQLASEMALAMRDNPSLRLVLGHGSGSYGHWEASQHHTRDGVATPDQWRGFARVSAAALELNRIVTAVFSEAGVPILSLQPSASYLARNGEITTSAVAPLLRALQHGLVPLVFGDVAFDDRLGGTILSTEDIFVHLAPRLHPSWILLLGNAPGVLDEKGGTIALITPESYPQVRACLGASADTDVTGGMADKVARMVGLVQQRGPRVRIMGGTRPLCLRDVLRDPAAYPTGTLIQTTQQF